jgi:hypothetical protein
MDLLDYWVDGLASSDWLRSRMSREAHIRFWDGVGDENYSTVEGEIENENFVISNVAISGARYECLPAWHC